MSLIEPPAGLAGGGDGVPAAGAVPPPVPQPALPERMPPAPVPKLTPALRAAYVAARQRQQDDPAEYAGQLPEVAPLAGDPGRRGEFLQLRYEAQQETDPVASRVFTRQEAAQLARALNAAPERDGALNQLAGLTVGAPASAVARELREAGLAPELGAALVLARDPARARLAAGITAHADAAPDDAARQRFAGIFAASPQGRALERALAEAPEDRRADLEGLRAAVLETGARCTAGLTKSHGPEGAAHHARTQCLAPALEAFAEAFGVEPAVFSASASVSTSQAAPSIAGTEIPESAITEYVPGDGLTGREILKDIGTGLLEAPAQVAGGVLDAFENAGDFMEHILPLGRIVICFEDGEFVFRHEAIEDPFSERQLFEIEPAASATGGAVRRVAQFLTGFIPALRATKWAQAAGKAASFARVSAAGSAADAAVFSGQEERLADLVEAYPELSNPLTRYLASDPDDSEAEGRLKNAIEGLALGALAEPFVRALGLMRRARKHPLAEGGAPKPGRQAMDIYDRINVTEDARWFSWQPGRRQGLAPFDRPGHVTVDGGKTALPHEMDIAKTIAPQGYDVRIRGAEFQGPDLVIRDASGTDSLWEVKRVDGASDRAFWRQLDIGVDRFGGRTGDGRGLATTEARVLLDVRGNAVWDDPDMVRRAISRWWQDLASKQPSEIRVLTTRGTVVWINLDVKKIKE